MPPQPALQHHLSVVRALWKRRLLICLATALAGTVCTAVIFSLPAVYRAEAVILVESQRIPERFVASTVSAELNDRLNNLKQQILSYSRLLNIINKYGLYSDKRRTKAEEEIIELMRKDTNVEMERGWTTEQPGAFRITYDGPDPAVVTQVANELAELFIDQNLRSREVNAVGTTEFLEDQLEEAKKRLEEQEARLTDYKRTHNGELPQQENTLNASLGRLQLQLQSVQEQISRAEQTKVLRESELETAKASQAAITQLTEKTGESGPSGQTPAAADKESALLERQLASLRARYTESHPDVKALRETLARAKEREAQPSPGEKGPDSSGSEQEAGRRQGSDADKLLVGNTLLRERERVEQLQTLQGIAVKQIGDLQAERQRILRELAALQGSLQQLPLHEQQLIGLTRDYEISKANYQSLLNKKLAAQMATEMERNQKSERFTVLDSARVPEKPVKPDRLLLSLAAWPLCLLLGLAGGYAAEWNQNVFLGEWELPSETPILGRVPQIFVRKAGSRLAAAAGPEAEFVSAPGK